MGLRNSDSESGQNLHLIVGGASIVVRIFESGQPDAPDLLVLHGWGSSSAAMGPLTSRLSARFHVIAFDFPGHGLSAPPPHAWGMDEQVELVLEVARKKHLSNFGIVGHSNGGRVALELASRSPSDQGPEFLALIAPSGIRRKRTVSYFIRLWTAKILKAPFLVLPEKPRELGLDWVRHSLIWRLLGSSDYRQLSGVMRETFVRTVNHYFGNGPNDRGLNNVTCEVVLFWGSDDTSITRNQMDRMLDLLPNAGLFVVEGFGHHVQLEQPDVISSGIVNIASFNIASS